jgi:hypothetical protein
LGFGLLSVVPARAAAIEIDLTADVTSSPDAGTTDGPTPGAAGASIVMDLIVTADVDTTDADDVLEIVYTLDDPNGTDVTSSATFTVDADVVADATVTRSGSTFTITVDADGADFAGGETIGTLTFTPKMGGIYNLSSAATDETVGGANAYTLNDVDYDVYVSGAGASISASGKGTSTIGAVTGGVAKVDFAMAAHANSAVYHLTSSGVGSISSVVDGANTVDNPDVEGLAGATDWSQGAKVTAPADNDFVYVHANVASAVAGVQTLTWTAISAATGAPTVVATATITWGAAPAASATYSTAYIAQGAAAGSSTTNALGASLVRTAGGQAGNITVTTKSSVTDVITAQSLCAVVTSGPGLLSIVPDNTDYNGDTGNSYGRTVCLTAAQVAANDEISNIAVFADGTAGVATITITSGTTTLATKSVTFYGTVATLNVTQNLSIARASATGAELGCDNADCDSSTVALTPAVVVEALDSAGNVVPGLVISAVTSNSAVIASASITEDDGTEGDGDGYYNASVTSAPGGASGATATVTFRTLLSTGAFVSSTPVTFTLGGSAYTHTLTLDKATYVPGEAIVVTRSAVDSSGNPVYDGVAAPAVSFNKAIGGTSPIAGEYVGGKLATSATKPTVFAPSMDGAFTASVTGAVAGVASQLISATATVSGNNAAAEAASDAAAEAIDAANAATDAANLAAEAADAATVAAEEARDAADAATAAVEELATQVATLMAALKAQITTLANTVAKIAKKVKA